MCYVSATELKKNLSHYLELSQTEDVYVTKNNKVISVLVDPKTKAMEEFLKCGGILKEFDEGRDYKEVIGDMIMERLERRG